jgi:hypothetical protein
MKAKKRNLKVITGELLAAMKHKSANIIAIGNLLIEAKEQIEHGSWLPWLEENFGSSDSTAENYMAAAKFAAKFPTVANLKLRPTALYWLGINYPDTEYIDDAIELIFKEAETKWVTRNRADEIHEEIWDAKQDAKTTEALEAETAAKEQAERDEQEEIERILDGPPP